MHKKAGTDVKFRACIHLIKNGLDSCACTVCLPYNQEHFLYFEKTLAFSFRIMYNICNRSKYPYRQPINNTRGWRVCQEKYVFFIVRMHILKYKDGAGLGVE